MKNMYETEVYNSGDIDPLVSIVVPTYNRGNLLQESLDSINKQTYSRMELVVVDDHSTPPAKEFVEKEKLNGLEKIRIIRHRRNQGANVARNTGIEAANGKYIAFLDDDDRWEPKKVEKQVNEFRRSSEDVGVVYTWQRCINEVGETTTLLKPELKNDVTRELLEGARMVPFSSLMVRSSVIEEAGLPDEQLPRFQDREWCIRLSRVCQFGYVPELLLIRTIGEYESIGDRFEEMRDTVYPTLLERYDPIAQEYGGIVPRKANSVLAYNVSKAGIHNERYSEALRFAAKSLLFYPLNYRSLFCLLIAVGGNPLHRLGQYVRRNYLYEKS